jgi:hypothetical protein
MDLSSDLNLGAGVLRSSKPELFRGQEDRFKGDAKDTEISINLEKGHRVFNIEMEPLQKGERRNTGGADGQRHI